MIFGILDFLRQPETEINLSTQNTNITSNTSARDILAY